MKLKFLMLAATAAAMMMSAVSCGDKENTGTGEGEGEGKDTTSKADNIVLNTWMDAYLAENYLWNTEYKTLSLNKEQNYTDFLSAALNGVAAQGDVNKEDGHWTNNKRDFFYSYITRNKIHTNNAPAGTRVLETDAFGYGFTGILKFAIGTKYYLTVLGVVPGSPADKGTSSDPGLTRGTYITRVDGTLITAANIDELAKKLTPTTASTLKVNYVTIEIGPDGQPETSDVKVKNLSTATYTNSPIIYTAAMRPNNTPEYRVGYIAYDLFNAAFDKQLISTFQTVQKASNESLGGPVTDLILDLRYNQGGYLKSSVMLATLLTGESKKGELYCRTKMNADRMAKMEPQEYRIGQKKIADNDGGTYDLIETALASSLNLKRVFIFTGTNTASASELIIAGLRGMDIEVNLIGLTTNGKNVGMEAQTREYNGYEYDFSPITFRLENGKGFSDYSTGFKPDVEVNFDRGGYLIGDYGSAQDPLFLYAITWIAEGKKPEVTEAPATRSSQIRAIGEPIFAKRAVEGNIMRK